VGSGDIIQYEFATSKGKAGFPKTDRSTIGTVQGSTAKGDTFKGDTFKGGTGKGGIGKGLPHKRTFTTIANQNAMRQIDVRRMPQTENRRY